MSGAENIFLGRPYPKTAWGTINWRALYGRAQEILETLGVHIPVNVPVRRLSRGDQAMISIARAFAGEASIFVMDEPTALLTDEEVRNLFKVIRSLKARGHTILYVSHRLEEIFEICDRITVMRDGSVVTTQPLDSVDQAQLIRLMIGRSLADTVPPAQATLGEPILYVKDLCGRTVHRVSFTLRAGEILGLAGMVGAGRTNILRMIYGADPIQSGQIWFRGTPFQPCSPRDAIRQGIMLVPEERRSQGLVLSRSILDNITLPHLSRLASGRVMLNPGRERAAGEETSQTVRLKASSLAQKVSQLSGGNQQKVVFARWLAGNARILLLDEPTRGVDVGARYEIYRIIRELTGQGIAVLLVSSDLTELLGLADRLIVMREGRQVAELGTTDLTQETVLRYCYGEEQ
jgi:ribose transport system ATP-binding protein